jgi:Tfp pilus assembly protein PilN
MRAVNLLPREETKGRRLPPLPVLVACGGVVVVAAFIAVSFLSAASTVQDRRQALADARATLAAVPQPAAPPAVASKLPQERSARVGALATVLGGRIAFDRLMREISQVVPNDVWLQSLTASAPAETTTPEVTTATEADGFSLQGYTYSQEGVARFLARLEVVPDLVDVTLGSSTAATVGGRDVVQFDITASVRKPGAAS